MAANAPREKTVGEERLSPPSRSQCNYHHKFNEFANNPSCECLSRVQILVIIMTVASFEQAMVHYNRLELLNHPVCKKYLAMKWYGC